MMHPGGSQWRIGSRHEESHDRARSKRSDCERLKLTTIAKKGHRVDKNEAHTAQASVKSIGARAGLVGHCGFKTSPNHMQPIVSARHSSFPNGWGWFETFMSIHSTSRNPAGPLLTETGADYGTARTAGLPCQACQYLRGNGKLAESSVVQ
jgi:hypothetical protein